MPTIREVYDPLVQAALIDDPRALSMLADVGTEIYKASPGFCKSFADGIKAAKENLDYYCQYFDQKTAHKVKDVYGLGRGLCDPAYKHNHI